MGGGREWSGVGEEGKAAEKNRRKERQKRKAKS